MFFCIPLLPKAKAHDWNLIGTLLNGTLRSLANQRLQRLEVILAAHDIPNNFDAQGLTITHLEPHWTPESIGDDPYRDKNGKKQLLGAEVGRRGGGYAMILDADDRVSDQLVNYVYRKTNPHGYIASTGYAFDYGNRAIAPLPGAWPKAFHFYCGSCAVWNLTPEELPRSPTDGGPNRWNDLRSHVRWFPDSVRAERPLLRFPFPAVAYFQNTGENNHAKVNETRKNEAAVNILANQVPLTPELIREFALDEAVAETTTLEPAPTSS